MEKALRSPRSKEAENLGMGQDGWKQPCPGSLQQEDPVQTHSSFPNLPTGGVFPFLVKRFGLVTQPLPGCSGAKVHPAQPGKIQQILPSQSSQRLCPVWPIPGYVFHPVFHVGARRSFALHLKQSHCPFLPHDFLVSQESVPHSCQDCGVLWGHLKAQVEANTKERLEKQMGIVLVKKKEAGEGLWTRVWNARKGGWPPTARGQG